MIAHNTLDTAILIMIATSILVYLGSMILNAIADHLEARTTDEDATITTMPEPAALPHAA